MMLLSEPDGLKEPGMSEAKEKAFSTSLTADVGMRVKVIAQRENRSYANVIESAVKVFTLFPKEVRDILIDAAADADAGPQRLTELSRSLMRQDAMRRLEQAAAAVATHIQIEPDDRDYHDAEVVERHA
jgi:ABC-type phosphate transport system ATPase subunit